MNIASAIALAIFVISVIVGGHSYWSALEEVRPWLPAQFQGYSASRQVLDAFIWDRSIPASARRKYFRSLVFGCIFMTCITVLVWINEPLPAAALFSAICIYGLAHTFMRWWRYRDLL